MIELYVGTTEEVEFRAYSGGTQVDSLSTPTVVLRDTAGVVLASGDAIVNDVPGEDFEFYTFQIDSEFTQEERELTLEWLYEPAAGMAAKRTEQVQVVTPYVYPEQVRTEFPVLQARTYDELRHLERAVRYTINAFTGQSFGLEPGRTYMVHGSGAGMLSLPRRLAKLHSIGSAYTQLTMYTGVQNDGWSIALPRFNAGYVDVKADIGLGYGPDLTFHGDRTYAVTGDWGWEFVPAEIQQAASILVGRYTEPEQNWRRYNVKSVKANDWAMEMSRLSTETTGDADVDLMLQRYKAPFVGVL